MSYSRLFIRRKMSLEKGIDRIGIALGKLFGLFFGVCIGLLALAWCCDNNQIDFSVEFNSVSSVYRFFKSLIITLFSPLFGFLIVFSLVSLIFDWITKRIIWIVEGFKE